MIRLTLQHAGHDVETAEDGPQALQKFGDGKGIDLVLLDQRMPGMSGIELRRRLNAVRSKLPVIFITAVDDEAIQREAMEVGCVACLHKPFQASLLIGAIDKATS